MKQFIFTILVLLTVFSCKQDKTAPAINEKSGEAQAKEIIAKNDAMAMHRGMEQHPDNVLGGLKVGDKVENFTAMSNGNLEVDLYETLKSGPVMLVFYRGNWCPKCVKHLSELQANLLELSERGVKVLAVTPEKFENIAKITYKSQAAFPIIYDQDQSIMKNFKVFYKAKEDYMPGLAENQGQDEAFLPVPATYLIGQDGKVLYSQYHHNHNVRASAMDILYELE